MTSVTNFIGVGSKLKDGWLSQHKRFQAPIFNVYIICLDFGQPHPPPKMSNRKWIVRTNRKFLNHNSYAACIVFFSAQDVREYAPFPRFHA